MTARKRVYHGTREGYDKHERQRRGAWTWPACERCKAAKKKWRTEYAQRPDVKLMASQRSIARQRAHKRLKDAHRGEYAKYFTEEMSILRDGGSAIVEGLLAEMRRLTGHTSVEELERAVQQRSATLKETEFYFAILDLRRRIGEAQERVAQRREPALTG